MNTCLTGMKKQLRSVIPCWLFPITVINITMLNVHLLESHLNYTFRISRFKSNLFIYLASFTIINVSRCFRESRDLQQATVERKKQKTLTEPGSYGGWGVGGGRQGGEWGGQIEERVDIQKCRCLSIRYDRHLLKEPSHHQKKVPPQF